MPLYLKPGVRAAVYLDHDAGEEKRATFYFKAMKLSEQMEFSDAYDALYEGVTYGREILQRAHDLLASKIEAWDNLPDDFQLSDLSYMEIRELLSKVLHGHGLTFEEKKD